MAVTIASLTIIVFAAIWIYQFIQLMMLSDTDFPGKYDKILWVAAFVCVFLLAPLAFMGWKNAYLSLRAQQRRTSPEDE
jgi:hypothetical protein